MPYDKRGHVGDIQDAVRDLFARESSQVMLHVDLHSVRGQLSCDRRAPQPIRASNPLVHRCVEITFRSFGPGNPERRRVQMFDEIPVKVVLARRNSLFSWNVQITKW